MKPSNSKSNNARRTHKRRKAPTPAPAAVPPDDVSISQHGHVEAGEHGDRGSEQRAGGREGVEEEENDEERKTLEWLMGAFSSASLQEVESACHEARGDAYRAAGILAGRGIERRKGAGRKQKKVVAASGMVANVIGKGYGRAVARTDPAEGRRREDSREMEGFLFGMMGEGCELDVGVIRDVLGQCGFDFEKAVDTLLDISSPMGSLFKNIAGNDYMLNSKKFMDTSQEVFAADCNDTEDKLSDKTTESSSGTSENDHEYRHPAHCSCGEETCLICNSEEDPSLSQTNKQELQKKVLLSLFNMPDYSQREPKLMDWKKVVKKLESFGQGLEFSVALANDTNPYKTKAKEDIYQAFRGAARNHWDTMKSYYQRAAVAYSKGDRAHASYLSEKGKYFSELAREADEKASREIFEARNKNIQNEITIDLHGQHVKQAMGLLKLHLLIFTYTPSIQLLRVITGCGSHGVGKGKLKQSVIKLAEKEGIQWREENAGIILMKIDSSKVYSFIESDDGDLD